MNLLHLKYFYEVARTGSFTSAAAVLRISQPAVSKLVRLLEADLNQTLIDRRKNELRLTAAGEILFQSASKIFSEVEKSFETLRQNKTTLSGEWSVGASDTLAIHLLPAFLGAFKIEHPKVKMSLFSGTSTQIKTELFADRCKLGIFFTPIRASEPFESRVIKETEFWPVIAKENRWFRKGRVTLNDIKKARVPRIESRHTDYSTGFPAHFHSLRLGLSDPPWLEVNQHEIKKRLILKGFGFSLLIKESVEAEVTSGALIRIHQDYKLKAPIFAVWRKGRDPGPISRRFLEPFFTPL